MGKLELETKQIELLFEESIAVKEACFGQELTNVAEIGSEIVQIILPKQ